LQTTQPSQLLSLQTDHSHNTTNGLAKCSILLFTKCLVQGWAKAKVIVNEDLCGAPQSSVISQLYHNYFLPNASAISQLQHKYFPPMPVPYHNYSTNTFLQMPVPYLKYATTTSFQTPVPSPLHHNYLLPNASAIISTTPQTFPSKFQYHISTTPQLLPHKCQCHNQLHHNYYHLNASAISQQHNYFQMPVPYLNYTTTTSRQIIFNSPIAL